ncbi:MAG TPA: DUF2889 domain-containing protein [Rubrivivax sp.]|jgi:hypothetical protein|nr:DUF2889 domain-containing protein [Rubrivivax sp.]
MTFPQAAATRRLKHRRQIDVQVFSRGDGLWEVDATLTDSKTRAANMADGLRPAGTPIHDMLLRLVVNERFDILEAGSQTRWMPYPGRCGEHGDVYGRLVGLNLLQDFRKQLRSRVGGVLGCTHITELAQVLPTAVVQAFAGEVLDTRGDAEGASRPFQIDRCHALRRDGDVVLQHYPRWYQAPGAAPAAGAVVSATVPIHSSPVAQTTSD